MSENNLQNENAEAKAEATETSASDAFQTVSNEWFQQASTALENMSKLQDQLLRSRAEFDNFRKRTQRDREDAMRYANEAILTEILPILDNFELGMKAAENAPDTKSITQGLSMVLTQFQKFLTDFGVKPIEAMGKPFDPKLHEAVGQEINDDVPDHTVIAQHRKGYMLHDRLIRPATVIVSQASTSQPAQTES
jgi:molecular chaperone GrpE